MAESHGNAKNTVKAALINVDFNNRKLGENNLEPRIEL